MLKKVGIVASLIFVYFIALLIENPIEREIRNSIQIYPEFS